MVLQVFVSDDSHAVWQSEISCTAASVQLGTGLLGTRFFKAIMRLCPAGTHVITVDVVV